MNEDKLLTTLEALKNEFTGYEEHERKRAMQAQKRNDEYDCQFHTIYANAYRNIVYNINLKINEIKGA